MTNQADTALTFALAQVGKPYVWGKSGPDSYDCSGLVMAAYAHAGVILPHSTYLMVNMGTEIDPKNIAPGDLVFPEAGHVQMWVGNGNIVEAPEAGENVRVVKEWGPMWRVRRVTSQPGTGSTSSSSPSATITSAASTTQTGFSLSDVGNTLSGIGSALKFISDPHNWLRLVEFMVGVALLMFAIYELSKDM